MISFGIAKLLTTAGGKVNVLEDMTLCRDFRLIIELTVAEINSINHEKSKNTTENETQHGHFQKWKLFVYAMSACLDLSFYTKQ